MFDRILNVPYQICLTESSIILTIYVWQDIEYILSYTFDKSLGKLYHISLTNPEYALSHVLDRILNKLYVLEETG